MREINEIDSPILGEVVDEIVDHLTLKLQAKGTEAFSSSHEIYGIIAEEVSELLEAVKLNDKEELELELKDIIVAGIWGLASLKQGEALWSR